MSKQISHDVIQGEYIDFWKKNDHVPTVLGVNKDTFLKILDVYQNQYRLGADSICDILETQKIYRCRIELDDTINDYYFK